MGEVSAHAGKVAARAAATHWPHRRVPPTALGARRDPWLGCKRLRASARVSLKRAADEVNDVGGGGESFGSSTHRYDLAE